MVNKGTLFNAGGKWKVMACTYWEDEVYSVCHELVPAQQSYLNVTADPDTEIHSVEFQIVDEFSHPEEFLGVPLFEGKNFARLI